MPYKITNVSLEHQHTLKRRMASCLQMEPVIAGKRLPLRQSTTITDEQYEINKAVIEQGVKNGILVVESTMPYIPLTMPEPAADKIRGIPAESFAIDEAAEEIPEEAPAPTPPKAPESAPVASQPTTQPSQNFPQQGGFNQQQRRDDRKRGR